MFKRVLMVFILGASIVAMRGSNAEAHLAGYTYSPTFRHIASYDCLGHFYQIPNPVQHPALFECIAVVQEFQVLCANPQGKVTTPGVSSGPITLMGQDLFTEADVIAEKTKGRADKSIRFADENSPLLNDRFCAERNRNWKAVDELILSVDLTLKTFECADESCVTRGEQAYEARLHCTVPSQYSLPDNPPPGGGIPTDYNCGDPIEAHCDQGDVCPIP